MNDKYNGWTNRETWATFTYITNEEDRYNELRGQSASDIKEYFDRYYDLVMNKRASRECISMMLDIGSIWRVDWIEIALALKND